MREFTAVLSGMMLKLVARVDLSETHLTLSSNNAGPLLSVSVAVKIPLVLLVAYDIRA